jgi:MFS superfamily sulfate permease-like transporter
VAILLTDLLIGVLVGLLVGAFFIIRGNYHSSITLIVDENRYLLRFYKDLSFVHKFELKRVLDSIPEGADLLIDLSRIGFIDLDNAEIINDYLTTAKYKDIQVRIKMSENNRVAKTLNEAAYESV